MMKISALELSALLNGKVEGDENVMVSGPSKIEEGVPGTISFLGNAKYETFAYSTNCSILLVNNDFVGKSPIKPTLIRVENVYASVALMLEKFGHEEKKKAIISEIADIADSAILGDEVSIGAFSVISVDAQIGDNALIYEQVYIGPNVTVGKNAIFYPGVKIYKDCVIGDNCILHANVVIGADGFGFAPQEDGTFKKIPQLGNVILEDNVEIGAHTAVDRASIGSTILRKGVKLDNLIQVAHNVEIGENTVIAAQTGIAGSTKIGKNCMIGGQVAIAGHIKVGDGVKVQAQSGIAKNTKDGAMLFGSPAIGYTDFIKSYGVFKKLPQLYKQISVNKDRIDHLSNHSDD